MTQFIIDIGAVPDDGQGDPLRTAFDYTNENFNQIFAAGPVLSNIQIGNNTITTTVLNSNLILSPSGIGRVQFNNTLFPRLTNVYDIGTPSLRFNSIYLGTGGIDTTGGITTTGNITASYFIGNGSQLTGIVATTGSQVINGNSNINIPAAGSNIFVTVNGTSNVVTFANTGVYVAGTVSATGNIAGNYILGNGALLTGINVGYGNSNVADFLPTYTGNLASLTGPVTTTANVTGGNLRTAGQISSTGNITGGNINTGRLNAGYITTGTTISAVGNISTSSYFIGDGSLLTGINANYGNSNVAAFLPTYTGNLVSLTGPVTTTANVTGGNLRTSGTILASGNITAANLDTGKINASNIAASGSISAVANITTGAYFIGDGSQLTNLPAGNYSNANVAAFLPTYTGSMPSMTGPVTTTANITGGNLRTAGQISATGNITGGNVDASRVNANTVTVTTTISAAGNITGNNLIGSTVTGTTVTAIANVVGGNITTGGQVSATGNIQGGNLNAPGGTVTSNIVSATGTIQGGNFVTAGSITATGNIIGGNVDTGNVHAGNINVDSTISAVGNVYGNNLIGSSLSVSGNLSAGNVSISGTFGASALSASGNITGGNLLTAGNVFGSYFVGNGALLTGITVSAGTSILNGNSNVVVAANGNITISSAGVSNVASFANTGAYIIGEVSATGNVTGSYLIGNGAFITGLPAGYSNADVANYLPTYTGNLVSLTGPVITTANISGNYFIGNGSLLTGVSASDVSANALTGNTLSSNVIFSSLTQVGNLANLSVTGNATVGNVLTAGAVSATGNVTGNYILGNGALLTGVITSVANINNGTSNVTVVSSGGNVSVGVGGTGNVAVFATTGAYITGAMSASGNITGGNVLTDGLISSTGTITGSSLLGSVASLSGNVTGGNLTTAGLITASGNILGNNVFATGFASVTGNVIAGNVNTSNIRPTTGELTITTASGNLNLQPTGNIVLANTFINSVAYPAQDTDAATKLYVDNMVSSALAFHAPAYAATTIDLATATSGTISYTQPNGVSNGVGAYLSTTGSFNLIDTANVQTAGTRILVKNEGNAVYNGMYTWSNATVIVRSTDADEYGPDSATQLSLNDYFFTTNGNVNAGSAFVVNAPTGTITFGTSNITFALFSQTTAYTANVDAGLSLIGTQFNAKVDNNTTAFDVTGNIIVKAGANLTTPNIGAATGTSLSLIGNVNSGNVNTGGLISASGNVTGGNILSNNYYYANGTPVPPGIIYTANTAPPVSPAPKVTDQWYDTANDVLYEYLYDGTSNYWIDTTSPAFAGGVVANVAISGTLLPVANVSYDVGNSTAYFRNTYTQNLYTNNRLPAYNMPLGAVVQTVMSSSLGGSTTNSGSYADISYANVTITPSSSTSKVLVIATGTSSFTSVVGQDISADTQLVRSPSTSLQIQTVGATGVGATGAVSYSYMDSPGTTSPVNYKLQQKVSNTSSTLTSTNIWLVAMEIAAS